MSEYSHLYIGNVRVIGWSNGVVDEVSHLFTPQDKTDIPHPRWLDNWIYEEGDEELAEMPCFQYEASASRLIARLELLGFSLERSKHAWDREVERRYSHSAQESPYLRTFSIPDDPPISEKQFFDQVSFEGWLELVRQILTEELEPIYGEAQREYAQEIRKRSEYLHYILNDWFEIGDIFGFPADNDSFSLRAILTVVPPATRVVLDCSPLVNWVRQERYECDPPEIILAAAGISGNVDSR